MMNNLRIRIDDRVERARGVLEMSKRGRVVCLRGDECIVPQPAILTLDNLGIRYSIVREDDPDDAVRALRDLVTSTV